jgi:hypothetical protein
MSADITLTAKQTFEMTFYLIFADSMDGEDFRERAKQMKANVLSDGFDALLAQHKKSGKLIATNHLLICQICGGRKHIIPPSIT